jgi:glycosyltransferase involved in cell wall biosynthesis
MRDSQRPRFDSVLHVSHTDISRDGRIIKELSALASGFPSLKVSAVGLPCREGAPSARPLKSVDVRLLPLWSRRLAIFGSSVRHSLSMVEFAVRVLYEGVRKRPTLVHCHDVIALPAGWLVSIVVGSRLIYDAHELESKRNGQSALLGNLVLAVENWCWRRIALLVSVSPSIIDWYRDNLGPKPSILVMNSPVLSLSATIPITREPGSAGYFHRLFGIQAGTPVFIYVGIMMHGRGIEQVLEVFGRAGVRSHVVFMGYGDAVGVEDHARRFANIHLHPAVPHDQVVEYVRHADCGLCLIEDVSLSDRLCLPNKLFEYAFAGIPVLASRLPEIERAVREFGLGVCCENDAESIRQAVQAIERDGISPSTADLSELSWERQAERLRDAYRQLLGKQSRSVWDPPKMGAR